VTQDSQRYFRILGAGADGYSLIAHRLPPPPGGWQMFMGFLARFGVPVAYADTWSTVQLTLKK
jgi:hypothetical protein